MDYIPKVPHRVWGTCGIAAGRFFSGLPVLHGPVSAGRFKVGEWDCFGRVFRCMEWREGAAKA